MSLWIGHLPSEARTRDLEDIFDRYGRMIRCEIKNGYGFLEYRDERDAEDALHHEKDRRLFGQRIIIEWAKNSGRHSIANEECWRCGRRGHYARDCVDGGSSRRRSRSRDRDDRSRRSHRRYSRSPSRSRSRSRGRDRDRSRDRKRSPSRDRSPARDDKEKPKDDDRDDSNGKHVDDDRDADREETRRRSEDIDDRDRDRD